MWTTYIWQPFNKRGAARRLVEWTPGESRLDILDGAYRILVGLALEWILTSSNRTQRDTATKGLVRLFTDNLPPRNAASDGSCFANELLLRPPLVGQRLHRIADDGATPFSEDSVANGYGTNYVPGFENRSYGDSVYDARQRLAGLYNYEIPVTLTIRSTPVLNTAFGGWHFAGITALQSGFPITIYDGGVYNSLYCDQFSFVNCPDVPNTSTFHIKQKIQEALATTGSM